jgi:glycosyltransferase involved in cell wall biosynthesis
MATAGHTVDYVALAPEGLQRQVDWGHITYVASSNRYVTPFLQYLKTRRRVQRYDIVHAHGIEGLGFAIHNRAFQNIRLVNGFYPATIHRFPWNMRSPFDPYCYFSCKWADMIITNSHDNCTRISSAYGVPRSRIRLVWSAVDDSFLISDIPQKPSTRFSLLYCGHMSGRHQVKGLDLLLEAIPRILASHDVTLSVIGTGDLVQQYKAACRELGLEKRVRFLGFIEHSKLPAYFRSAHLFALPSRREGMPLVVVEAMASALPVVATAIGGVPEVVTDGETGLLVPPNDPRALADAVIDLLDDPGRMKSMGHKGRERVRAHFTWDKVAKATLKFYQEILQ